MMRAVGNRCLLVAALLVIAGYAAAAAALTQDKDCLRACEAACQATPLQTCTDELVSQEECHPIEVALFTTQCRHRCPAKPSTEVKNNGNSVARKLLHLLGEAAPATQAPDHNPGLADGDHGHSLVSASHRQVLGQLRKLQGTKDGDDDFPWWFLEDQESGKRRKLQGTKDGDDDFPWWFLEDQESGKRRKLMAGGNCERVCLKVPYKSVETRCELKFRKVASCRAISPSECMRGCQESCQRGTNKPLRPSTAST